MLQCVLLPLLMLPQHTHKHTCWHILKIPVAYRIINRYMHTYKHTCIVRAYKQANHSVKDLWSHFSQCPGSTRPFNTKKDVPTFLSAFNGLTEHLDLHLWLQRLYELVLPQKTVFSPHLSWAIRKVWLSALMQRGYHMFEHISRGDSCYTTVSMIKYGLQ